ncbi:PREDICTED: protein transport protein Sec61 subunit beta-like [Camelina sativa]|uniref:Protein transport protein Sec61 subunit beta-like n=1 Tax=Camelina sativa TaxID=90675 RepID=A0ABM0UNQ5_CAMSA|nr:PREDICTED: protein transport protein Sec61 subunit beta-like [Camelina sativa]
MARGSSQSQQSTSTGGSTARPGLAAQRGSAAATAGMRRRRLGGGGSASSGGGSAGGSGPSNMLRFYTDEAPGLKISPTVVLIMSLCFIGFVTALHVFGKLYLHKSGSSQASS